MPLKVIWGLLDLATLIILGSGLYLWAARLRASPPQRTDGVMAGGPAQAPERG
jgi:uncharacterized iron-regulated membrane protein